MKKNMVMSLLILQAFMFHAFADDCAYKFERLKFCNNDEDHVMYILKNDCTFEQWENSILTDTGTWEREDPNSIKIIRMNFNEGDFTARCELQFRRVVDRNTGRTISVSYEKLIFNDVIEYERCND